MAHRSRLYVLALCLSAAAGLWLGLPVLALAAWTGIELAIAAVGAMRRLMSVSEFRPARTGRVRRAG